MSEPSLRELQQWMQSRIRSGGSPASAVVSLNPQRGLPGEERLAVYAGGYVARIRESLAEAYEAVHHVLGEDAFTALARAYAQRHPSHESNLSFAGRHLAEFLIEWSHHLPGAAGGSPSPDPSRGLPIRGQEIGPAGLGQVVGWPLTPQLPFLPDLARLEWLVCQAFHAFDQPPMDPRRFAALPLEAWRRIRLVFQPSVGLIASAWPILDLWAARTQPREAIDIALVDRPQRVLVFRQDLHVRCERLDEAQWLLLDVLLNGQTLGAACARLAERAESLDGARDSALSEVARAEQPPVATWFSHWVHEGLLVGCQPISA